LRNEVVEELISDQVSENRGELDIEIRIDERNRGRTNEKGKRGEEWRWSEPEEPDRTSSQKSGRLKKESAEGENR
jgi:hypothetical protein